MFIEYFYRNKQTDVIEIRSTDSYNDGFGANNDEWEYIGGQIQTFTGSEKNRIYPFSKDGEQKMINKIPNIDKFNCPIVCINNNNCITYYQCCCYNIKDQGKSGYMCLHNPCGPAVIHFNLYEYWLSGEKFNKIEWEIRRMLYI